MQTRLFFLMVMLAAAPFVAHAQTAAGGNSTPHPGGDTNMIFHSPRPLVESPDARQYKDAWGLDILFSNYGFGGGVFFRHEYASNVFGFVSLDISGIKNSNEVTLYDYYTNSYLTPSNKLNDVFIFPLTFGMQFRLLADAIAESFRPFVNAGVGPTMILAAPDSLEFFSGIRHAAIHIAPSFFIGAGANIGKDKRTVSAINFRYYFIPYKPGVESLRGEPITDLGGLFITLNWGLTF